MLIEQRAIEVAKALRWLAKDVEDNFDDWGPKGLECALSELANGLDKENNFSSKHFIDAWCSEEDED